MYQALRGHGTAARLVLLPHEGHGYQARESVLHVLYETDQVCKFALAACGIRGDLPFQL
jgi:dipeptidyl aminopeptidase/acylaminoacyl peptidase